MLGHRQHLGPILGHQNRVLKLRGRETVLGPHGPTIAFVAPRVAAARIDHRLDGKAHAGEQSIDATLTIWEVGDRRIEVELATESVTDVLPNDRKTSAMCFSDDNFANRADAATRRQCFDCQVHAIERALRHPAPLLVHAPNEKCLALIAMPAIDDGGDIDVDDVAIVQHIAIGDAVANHIIDTGAAALGEVLVTERRALVTALECPRTDEIVNVAGRNARDNLRPEKIHQLSVHLAGVSHRVLLGGTQHQSFLLLQHRGFTSRTYWLHGPSIFNRAALPFE